MMKASALLRLAQQRICAGWTQGQMVTGDHDDRHCAVAALRLVCNGGTFFPNEREDVVRYLATAMGCSLFFSVALEVSKALVLERRIAEWNDELTRTHAEVVAAFARAVVLAERDETRVEGSPVEQPEATPELVSV
jgi:hypothetical protein